MRTLPLLAVVVGFALTSAGCATIEKLFPGFFARWEETATSKMLLDAANDLLMQRENGYSVAQFKTAFGRKFTITDVNNGEADLKFKYKGKSYQMFFDNVNQQQGKTSYYFWVAAKSCKELVPQEKK